MAQLRQVSVQFVWQLAHQIYINLPGIDWSAARPDAVRFQLETWPGAERRGCCNSSSVGMTVVLISFPALPASLFVREHAIL